MIYYEAIKYWKGLCLITLYRIFNNITEYNVILATLQNFAFEDQVYGLIRGYIVDHTSRILAVSIRETLGNAALLDANLTKFEPRPPPRVIRLFIVLNDVFAWVMNLLIWIVNRFLTRSDNSEPEFVMSPSDLLDLLYNIEYMAETIPAPDVNCMLPSGVLLFMISSMSYDELMRLNNMIITLMEEYGINSRQILAYRKLVRIEIEFRKPSSMVRPVIDQVIPYISDLTIIYYLQLFNLLVANDVVARDQAHLQIHAHQINLYQQRLATPTIAARTKPVYAHFMRFRNWESRKSFAVFQVALNKQFVSANHTNCDDISATTTVLVCSRYLRHFLSFM